MKHPPLLLSHKLDQWFIVLRRNITFILLLILISCHFEGAAAQSTDIKVQAERDSETTRLENYYASHLLESLDSVCVKACYCSRLQK